MGGGDLQQACPRCSLWKGRGQGGSGGSFSLSWPRVVTGPGDTCAAGAWGWHLALFFLLSPAQKMPFLTGGGVKLGQALCIPNSCWCWGDGSCWVIRFCGISLSPEWWAVSTEAPRVETPSGKVAPPPLPQVQLWCEYLPSPPRRRKQV